MSRSLAIFLALCLLAPAAARAEDAAWPPLVIPDAVYKGVVGKALDVVPMDPEQRATLQRTNAVISNTMTARTLSVWAGLTNPILLIGGLIWGIYAASNIKADANKLKPDMVVVNAGGRLEAARYQFIPSNDTPVEPVSAGDE